MNRNEIYQQTLLELLAPVREFLEDESVSEVIINGPYEIFVERAGRLERTSARFESEEAVVAALRNAAQFVGKTVDDQRPILEARLPDGSRVQGVLRPVATAGPYVAIRRFFQSSLSTERLISSGSITREAVTALACFVRGRMNIVVVGGTGTGKTSLLNWLTSFIPEGERVGVIEDSKEVQVQHGHVFQLEARVADEEGRGAIPIRELFRASLRMRPDRIIVGEIRGGEAVDIIQAMVSGHGGCLATLHASHPRDALTRLETMAMMSDVVMPLTALRLQIASGLDVIVQLDRGRDGSRFVSHISEVLDYDPALGRFQTQELFGLSLGGADGAPAGTLVRTDALPALSERLRAHGEDWPGDGGPSRGHGAR